MAARLPESRDEVARPLQVGDRGGLGYLEAQLARRHGMAADLLQDEAEETVVRQVLPRQVDRAGFHAVIAVASKCGQGCAYHPAVDGGHEVVAFRRGQERLRRDDTAVLASQTQQQLDPAPPRQTRPQRDDLLCVQQKAVVFQAPGDARNPFHLAPAQVELRVVRPIDMDAIAALLLRRVARHVGGALDIGLGAAVRSDRHRPDAYPHVKGFVSPGKAQIP